MSLLTQGVSLHSKSVLTVLEVKDKMHVNTGNRNPTFKSGKARLPEFIQICSPGSFFIESFFQAYMMFVLNCAYARLQQDFQGGGNKEARQA